MDEQYGRSRPARRFGPRSSDASPPAGRVDAQRFLELSQGLKQALRDINAADLRPGDRDRWQQRLVAITHTARRDLERGYAELLAAEQELRRYLRRAAEQ
jgi:hypothetical protein